MEYSHRAIEKKWQTYWAQHHTFLTNLDDAKRKYYVLDMFPYPSGAGLHVGHPRGYTATDIIARFKRMQGFTVLHPIGWDAFGLPAEQYALQTNNHPGPFTAANINHFRQQLQALGFSYDYQKEVNTTDPRYYRWTQWIFLQLYNQGLAYFKTANVNWCPQLQTVLANEEVLTGPNGEMISERGGYPVVKKPMRQWMLKITAYAERLLAGLNQLDWPASIKALQRHWIGKKPGALIDFQVADQDQLKVTVFSTRPETIFGVSALVIAPDHPLINQLTAPEQALAVNTYQAQTKTQTDFNREHLATKTGVFLGTYVIHPFTKAKIPLWTGSYVLPTVGTGAVMVVPAHNENDYEFAKAYNLAMPMVIASDHQLPYTGTGTMINSDFLNQLSTSAARKAAIKRLEQLKVGHAHTSYRLRDWLFSRQRYWGEPLPLIHWADGRITALSEDDLPLMLPELTAIKPGANGQSPLIHAKEWLKVNANKVYGQRETNTMPQWAGSCWYYLAYLLKTDNGDYLPLNSKAAYDRFKAWLPVDLYIGGQEHAVLHLLYARFWHHVLYDLKLVPTPEPFQRLVNQGMILGPNNEKMSKSRGNVINPDDIIVSHGADALRLYEMFMGPLTDTLAWSVQGLDGARRWLDRVYRLINRHQDWLTDVNDHQLDYSFNLTIKKVSADYETLSFNTAIAQMMTFINDCYKVKRIYRPYLLQFCQLLNPIAPHITEEIWAKLGQPSSIAYSKWPTYDPQKLVLSTVDLIVQVNGKLKAKTSIPLDLPEAELIATAKKIPVIAKILTDHKLIKTITAHHQLVNFVVKKGS